MEERKQRAQHELNRLNINIKGDVAEYKETYMLKVDRAEGNGAVKCINFDEGLFVLEFDLKLNRDTYLSLLSETDQSIYFIYCFQGNCFYATQHNNHHVKLNELQTAIVKTNKNFAGGLVIGKDSDVSLNILRIDIDTYFKKHPDGQTVIAQKLKAFLGELNKRHNLVHFGKLNLEIAEYVRKLTEAKYADTLSELLYFEGICILILASHIEQYKRETTGKINSTRLIKREIQKLMEIARFIQETPEQQFTIPALSKKSGLSAGKLQEGFKFLYQRTVSDFIRNARLEKAEKLIRETDMNVSEVVYAIGLTSRSYFCKIFKEKYHCNPKRYKTKQNIHETVSMGYLENNPV
ncbi:helix-turn-helix domain-containing protein [Muricauda sp. JGD-17]|uniref:Helix-turn-helix domain-containing protein n=1 Tax=Flagellimonas ochracea TaxID=2696472 RepID=A0A964TBD3_9FLAO|nr:AraC family transcriptional regulator [Allomuricauda ochracea]NAY91744.1 helix-turn-helix domain-containing protein [Allomuricauda ochracea]